MTDATRRQDERFGGLLVRLGFATAEQVEQALALQARGPAGTLRRLGVLLVEQGVLSPHHVLHALAAQGKRIDACSGCGFTVNVAAGPAPAAGPCPQCGGALKPLELVDAWSANLSAAVAMEPREPDPGPLPRAFGRYRLLERVGVGPLTVAWKASEGENPAVLALKHLRPEHAPARTQACARFLRGVRLAARLTHPHVLSPWDVGEAEGLPYVTLPWLGGGTLAAVLDRTRADKLAGRAVPEADLRRELSLLADVAEAVACAHAQGIVHHDLKPGNVLFDETGHPYVTDFGLACEIPPEAATGPDGGLRLRGPVLGTPAWVGPEQAVGDTARIGPAADVWALGAMLFDALCGEAPFARAGAPWEVLRASACEEPPSPAARNPHVPEALAELAGAALTREPVLRPSAEDFAADLRRWLRGEPLQVRGAGLLTRMWKRLGGS